MTITDVGIRFASMLDYVDNYQAVSLPLIAESSEIIFTYYASPYPEGYIVEEITGIGFRDLNSSDVTIKPPQDVLTAETLQNLTDRPNVVVRREVESSSVEDAYYDYHERILEIGLENSDDDLLRGYVSAFAELVPESELRKIYLKLGAPTFRYISRRLSTDPQS